MLNRIEPSSIQFNLVQNMIRINILQKRHDFITEKFIDGLISLDDFLMLEDIFIENEKLYTIYLN